MEKGSSSSGGWTRLERCAQGTFPSNSSGVASTGDTESWSRHVSHTGITLLCPHCHPRDQVASLRGKGKATSGSQSQAKGRGKRGLLWLSQENRSR